MDSARLSGLARTKLEALIGRAFPEVSAPAQSFGAGAVIVDSGRAFVYLTDASPSPLSAALAWGQRHEARDLHVIVDDVDPVLALQASGLSPSATVWRAVGTELERAEVGPSEPDPEVPQSVLDQTELLEAAGCDAVVEHGVLIGEVLGLEVARVVVDQDGDASVRVGVGLYDQDAHDLIHADALTEERLQQVVGEVRQHRRADTRPHPLNRLARERWLRRVLVNSPNLLALESVEPVIPLVPRGGIREEQAVAAIGTSGTSRIVVVTSTGIDLDMVPIAAGHVSVESADGPIDEVMLVLPERDHHAVIQEMATSLRVPASLRSIPNPWP